MKKLVLSLIAAVGMMSSTALADVDYGLEVGIRQQSGDTEAVGQTTSSQMGLQFGATAHFPISGPLHLRTGMLYTQRPLVLKPTGGGAETKLTMNFFDVPLALMYKFEEYAGVYAGISLAMSLDKSADNGGTIEDEKSPLIPILIGASFKFAPNLGANLYFESASGEVARNLKNYRAVGANLQITFD